MEAPENAIHSLSYPDVLAESFFADFLRFILSTLEGKVKEEAKRTLWSLISNAGEEKRDKGERNAERAWYSLMPKLLMTCLENDSERV